MVETAVIMAAGKGTRFGDKTSLIPKGFIPVDGVPMVIRSIELLIQSGIKRIIIGTGYHKEKYEELQSKYHQIECCFSEFFASTNSMWTLANCAKLIGNDDFLLLESDLIFEQNAISELLKDEHPDILLAAAETKFQDQYYIEYNTDGYLTNCSTKRDELNVCGEFVGIHRISNRFYLDLCKYYEQIKQQNPTLGYEFGLLNIAQNNHPLYVLKMSKLRWYEIDDEKDLEYAQKLFNCD